MPKHKKKFKCEKEFDRDNDDNDDNLSVTSSTATSSIYHNDSPSEQQFDDSIETKLDTLIDGLQEKSYKEREEALKSLIELFKKHCLFSYLIDKKFTLTDSLLKCLKRGKLNEQLLSLKSIMLTFIQFGCSIQSEEFLQLIYETLINFIKNDQFEHDLRGSCIKALCLALYITVQMDETLSFMEILEEIYDTENKTNTNYLSSALSSWSLLLTIMPINYTNKILLKSLEKLEYLLENTTDVDFRVCIGETIALLYELTSNRRDLNSNLRKFDSDNLIVVINSLIKESSKSTSKKDRRTQHTNFRDILKIIEDYNQSADVDDSDADSDIEFDKQCCEEAGSNTKEFIKVSNQFLYLDNWISKKQYRAFSDLLGNGMNIHLLENEFLRDVFDLGPPVVNNGQQYEKQNKLSKQMRVSRNKEEFRYRTKDLNKKREFKSVKVNNQLNEDN